MSSIKNERQFHTPIRHFLADLLDFVHYPIPYAITPFYNDCYESIAEL